MSEPRFVVRRGSVRGQGDYLRADAPFRPLDKWHSSRMVAAIFNPRGFAEAVAKNNGGRVVRLISYREVKQRAKERGRQQAFTQVAKLLEETQAACFSGRTAMLDHLIRSVERMTCPCQGPLDDPGQDHIDACPWKDPNYPKGGPF